ncbi:hypothetical protein JCM10207_008019 [Rhodosporidiobolus poonsookiae]
MSNLIPSSLKTALSSTEQPHRSGAPPAPDSSQLLPAAVYTDCQTCRLTGTLTFAAVGTYALTVSRATAKTQVGKGAASLFGLGFLALAAGRWTAYTPPPELETAPKST